MRQMVLPTAISALCLCTGAATPAYAEPKYDRKIEQAAITIVAGKLGMIRGTHKIGEPHYLYPPIYVRSAEDGTLEPAQPRETGLLTVGIDSLAGR